MVKLWSPSSTKQTGNILAQREAAAEQFVGHWSQDILEQIVQGRYFLDPMGYSLKRIGVFERAALIRLDVLRGQRPSDPTNWSREVLEKRISALKEKRKPIPSAQRPQPHQRITRYRNIEPDPKKQARIAAEKQELAARKAAQVAELAQPPEVRLLKRQIQEVSAMISSKEQSLYFDTLNERAHDRIHETLQQDRARLVTLKAALAKLGKIKP